MSRDQLLIARKSSKGNVTVAEAASTNAVCVPPGVYDVEITHGAITGTVTVMTASVQESGRFLNPNMGAPSAPFVATQQVRTLPLDTSGGAKNISDRDFLRGVVIARWNDGLPNAGIDIAFTGTGNIASVQATFWPQGRAPQWNGLP